MNATDTDTDEITAYVEAVRAALAGLPEDTREGLLEDLPEHLAEVLADDVGTLTERLGPPSVYAAELLAGAGYVGGGFPDPPAPPRRRDALRRLGGVIGARLRAVDKAAGPLFGKTRASEFLVQLRPAWWVLRGYLVVMVIAQADVGGQIGLLPRLGNSELVGFLLIGAGVVASVWFGRKQFRMARPIRLAYWSGTAVLLMVALATFNDVDQDARQIDYYQTNYEDPYGGIADVYVYDQNGKLVPNVRIFDQNGTQLHLGQPYCYDEETDLGHDAMPGVYPYCAAHQPFSAEQPAPPVGNLDAPQATTVPVPETTG